MKKMNDSTLKLAKKLAHRSNSRASLGAVVNNQHLTQNYGTARRPFVNGSFDKNSSFEEEDAFANYEKIKTTLIAQ